MKYTTINYRARDFVKTRFGLIIIKLFFIRIDYLKALMNSLTYEQYEDNVILGVD